MADDKQTKKRLRQKAEPYQKILETLQEGYLLVDQQGHVHEANTAYCKMTGYSKEELRVMSLTDLRADISSEELLEVLGGIAEGDSRHFESQHRRKDGAVLDLTVSAAVIERDNKILIAGLVWNVTERKKAQKKLKAEKQRFESFFKHNPNSVFYLNREGHFLDANEQFEQLSGYSRQELLELNFLSLISAEDRKKAKTKFERAIEGEAHTFDIRGLTKKAEEIAVRITSFPMFSEDEIMGIYVIAEDLTEAKKAEKKLKESEQRWYRLIADNPQGVVVSVDKIIKYINKAGVRLLGYNSHTKIIGQSLFEFAHPDDWDAIKSRTARMMHDENLPHDDQKIIDKNGYEKQVIAHSVHIKYKGQHAIQTVLYDVTDRKRKEQVIKSSLKEKEIMLQEIHHRVKNNMAVISGLLELQALNTADKTLQMLLKESQMRIHSMAMIHEKLYASKSLANINFNEYAKELVKVIMNSIGDIDTEVTVRYRMDSESLNINEAIPCGLILNELVVNCYKHAFTDQETGTIMIGFTKDEKGITISVEDNGKGLPAGFDINNVKGLGTTIIKTLTKQLEGELQMGAKNEATGTCSILSFSQNQPGK